MPDAESQRNGRRQKAQPTLSVDDAEATYSGEWVLMRVAEFDKNKNPARGRIVTHSPRRSQITKAFGSEPPGSLDSARADHQPYYVFKAYGYARSARRLSDILSQIAHEETVDVPRLW